jgi:hypothetical protein
MNWWVIVVGLCLKSLHECLFMFVCWWGLNWCGCLWSLNESWEHCGFRWKMNLMMNLRWIGVMIRCLLLFWMPFDVYKPMYKFWGRIWGQGDQNWGFWVKLEWVHERNPKYGFPCLGKLAIVSCSVQQLIVLEFQVLQGRSGPS